MNEALRTIKIRPSTHQKLRLAAALSGEKMVDMLDRLVKNELAHLQRNVATNVADGTKDSPPTAT